MYVFGPGIITAIPQGATPTPVNVGMAEEISYDESYTVKSKFGGYRRAIAIGAGEIKATGKVKMARLSSSAMAAVLYGVPLTPGQMTSAYGESHAVPSGGGIVTATNGATFGQDLGPVYALTGLPLTRVAAAPTVGEYSLGALGAYTISAADGLAVIFLNYTYTVTTGYSIPLGNPLQGPTVTFGLNIMATDPATNKIGTFQIYNAVASKFGVATKQSDFASPDFDYECYAAGGGQYGQWNFPDMA